MSKSAQNQFSTNLKPGEKSLTSESAFSARLPVGWIRVARVAWYLLGLAALGVLLASLPGYATKFQGQLAHVTGGKTPPGAHFFAAASGVASLASALLSIGLAILLFRRKFTEPIGILVSYFLLIYGAIMAGPLEHVSVILPGFLSIAQILQGVVTATPLIALLMLFPNGKFVPDWTRWVVLLSIPWNFGLILLVPFDAANLARTPILSTLVAVSYIVFGFIGIYAQIYRYRKASTPAERGQTRWVIYGFALWFAYMLLSAFPYFYLTGLPPDAPTPWWGPASELGWWLSLNILPVCITIAITRHHLWNIDIVINRTLVYGALTLATMALYIWVVGTLGNTLQVGDSAFIAFLTTGLIAVIFNPLRERLQSWVNRLMYGDRDDPYSVLASLGKQLENSARIDTTLPAIVKTIAKTLKLPYVAISLANEDDDGLTAAYGTLPHYHPEEFPLLNQGESIGTLILARRSESESFTQAEKLLLADLTRQVGVAAHNVRLTADLQHSRQRIITAREEERRRLRRDLHDGLGPQLASQTLTLNAIEKLIDRDPKNAKKLIHDLRTQSQEAITSIRHLIYELRPPTLDELGLAEALKEGSANYRGTVQVEIDMPETLPPLPAAVEVAAYHIAQEAIVNAIRHAQASICRVRLEIINKSLHIEIKDDGRGLPDGLKAGVGFHSMQERVNELNGQIEFDSSPGEGTSVWVKLPLPREEQ
jgi:signal transduction histidine kinase